MIAADAEIGMLAHVDEAKRREALGLVREGRLKRIATRDDLESLRVEKRRDASPRRRRGVRAEVADLILQTLPDEGGEDAKRKGQV